MQIHNLKSNTSKKSKKRVGRGGKRGTYSGRGIKGQSSRAGRKMQPSIRELIKRYPKLKGYRRNPLNQTVAVNLAQLEKHFKTGDKITPKVLLNKKLIARIKGRTPKVKILDKGEIKKKLVFERVSVSASAKEKIKKAGGEIK